MFQGGFPFSDDILVQMKVTGREYAGGCRGCVKACGVEIWQVFPETYEMLKVLHRNFSMRKVYSHPEAGLGVIHDIVEE
jgi:hypothetical protein